MVEFFSEGDMPAQLIESELHKIKCSCKQDSNYFVFGNGFYCRLCFSKLKLQGQQYVQLLDLANIFEKSAQAYNDNKKSSVSDLKQLVDSITKKYDHLKKRKQQLRTDMNSQKNFTVNRVDHLVQSCQQQNTNHALEQLYEPSLTISSNLSITDLLARNLENLKVEERKGEVNYSFQEKDSTEMNQTVNRNLETLKKNQEGLLLQSHKVLDEFHKKMAQFKK